MRLSEIDAASSIVRNEASPEAEIIVGAVVDDSLEDELMITVIASGFDNTVNASAGHRASTSVLSRENPTIITSRGASTSSRTEYIPRQQTQQPAPEPAPAPVQRSAPGFRFGDDSVNVAPAPAAQPAPAQQIPMQQPAQQPAPAPVQQIPIQQPQQPAPAPVQPQTPVQMGGRPQANVAPQPEAKPAQKSAKPWFMFGKDGQ